MNEEQKELFDIYLLEMGIGMKERELLIDKVDQMNRESYVTGSNNCHKAMMESNDGSNH